MMQQKETIRAVQIVGRDQVEFVAVEMPALQPNHALIRPICLSLCGSDIYMVRYAPEADYPHPPGTSGHEMVGVVEAMDGTHPEVNVGDMVLTIAPNLAAMMAYYVAPLTNLLPLPSGVPLTHLVQAQQLGTVIYACQHLPNLIGKTVAVVGQGSAGLWFNFMARRMGAKRVIGIDLQAHRLAYSQLYGATDVVWNGETNEGIADLLHNPPDVVIEVAGDPSAINLAIELVKFDGFMLQFGVPHAERFVVAYNDLFRKRIQLKACVTASLEPNHMSTRMALDMIASGEIDVAPILTHTFSFDQVPAAYALQGARDAGNVKILVEME